jgi:hypothetical protein
MQKFITEKRKTIWTVRKDKSKADAISMANEKFKVKRDDLFAEEAWIKDGELWFERKKGAEAVWAIMKR